MWLKYGLKAQKILNLEAVEASNHLRVAFTALYTINVHNSRFNGFIYN